MALRAAGIPYIGHTELLAALTGLAITHVVVWAATFASIAAFSSDRAWEAGPLLLLLAGTAIFQLFFLTVGMLISLLVKRVRSVIPSGQVGAGGAFSSVIAIFQ